MGPFHRTDTVLWASNLLYLKNKKVEAPTPRRMVLDDKKQQSLEAGRVSEGFICRREN